MNIELRLAEPNDMEALLQYVRAYHEFEDIDLSDAQRQSALTPLLGESGLGRVWFICLDSEPIGYIALCFGYSIEFTGRDAFVDEMFIAPEHRGKGFGRAALELAKSGAARLGIRALHLEVARTNDKAQRLYRKMGFIARDKYVLMSTTVKTPAADE